MSAAGDRESASPFRTGAELEFSVGQQAEANEQSRNLTETK